MQGTTPQKILIRAAASVAGTVQIQKQQPFSGLSADWWIQPSVARPTRPEAIFLMPSVKVPGDDLRRVSVLSCIPGFLFSATVTVLPHPPPARRTLLYWFFGSYQKSACLRCEELVCDRCSKQQLAFQCLPTDRTLRYAPRTFQPWKSTNWMRDRDTHIPRTNRNHPRKTRTFLTKNFSIESRGP